MAPRSKKIRAPSDYFLWAPQEYRAQSENLRFSSERHSRQERVDFSTRSNEAFGKKVSFLKYYIIP